MKTKHHLRFLRPAICAGLLFLFFVATLQARAQTGRFRQRVDLGQPENRPFNAYQQELATLVLRGIDRGRISAFVRDDAAGTLRPLTPADLHKKLSNAGDSTGSGTILPGDLRLLELDVRQETGRQTQVQYVHFLQAGDAPEKATYVFTVAFAELAPFLNAEKALWIRNRHPLLFNHEVLHTYGEGAADQVYQLFNNDRLRYPRLTQTKNGAYNKVQIYDQKHQLIAETAFASLGQDKPAGEIRWMSEALVTAKYRTDRQQALTTALPEPKGTVAMPKAPAIFRIRQQEVIYLDRPENQKFFRPGQELFGLIRQVVDKGLLPNIYLSDSLTKKMSKAKWTEALRLDTEEVSANAEAPAKTARLQFGDRDITILTLTQHRYFDREGKIKTVLPVALGVYVGADKLPSGLEKRIAYFSLEDLYQAVESLPGDKAQVTARLEMLDDLMDGEYFSYWRHSSVIEAVPGVPKD